MKWIAVDYGERRTGLAVCDASELIVTPVTPQIEEKSLNKVAEAAAAARLAQGAEGVVCGPVSYTHLVSTVPAPSSILGSSS